MKYDPILCMMVDDSVKARDELSLAQKKQVVTELNGFLKKSYNFSNESEYARAYEDLRQMFITGSRKSISGLFENAVKKTGVHDADPIAALSNFKKTAEYGDSIKIDIGKGKTAIVQKEANGWYATIGNEKVKGTFNVIAGYLKSASAKDSASAIDKAIRACDSRVSTRNVVTSNIAFEEIKKMTGIVPEKVQQKGDTMEFYHSGVKVAEWDMNNAEVKIFV